MQKTKITVIGSNMMDLTTNIERMPCRGETLEAVDFDLMNLANHYAALSTLNTGTQKSFLSREQFDKSYFS